QFGRTPDARGPVSSDPDWDGPTAVRPALREHPHVRVALPLPFERRGLVLPKVPEHAQVLIGPRATLFERRTEGLELLWQPPRTNTDDQPAVDQIVDGAQ